VKATLSFSDGSPSMDLPIYKGSIGPDVIDIRKLYGADRQVHLRPGFPEHGLVQQHHHLHRR
jgi:citrate synthase